MNMHKRSTAMANGAGSRSSSNSLSNSLALTSLSGTSTSPRHNDSAATPRTASPAPQSPSRPAHPSPPPPFSAQVPPPPPGVSPHSGIIPGREPASPPRGRSQSSATLSQLHSAPPPLPPPPPLFAGPGGYYAYPIFAQPTAPSTDIPGLRASYSSPHLAYSYEHALHAQQQQQYQQQMPPPYPFPYAFQMGGQPTLPHQQPQMPTQPQSQPPLPPSPPPITPSRGHEYERDRRGSSSDEDTLAFGQRRRRSVGSRPRRLTRESSWSESTAARSNFAPEDVDAALRRPRRQRSRPILDETETDDPTNPPPTARRPQLSSLSPPVHPGFVFRYRHPSLTRVFPPIILVFRLLSIVPASIGSVSHAWDIYDTSRHLAKNTRLDYFLALLWALLTAHQCLAFTNGLFLRWKAYYPLLPTLIRLLALQAICWPATHLTLTTLDSRKRPLICWTVIGTTTCVSRSIQIWATSNLGVDARWKSGRAAEEDQGRTRAWMSSVVFGIGVGGGVGGVDAGSQKRWWDWKEVGLKCALPAAVLYIVMAWALLLSREFLD